MADKYQDEKRAKGLSGLINRNFGPDKDGHGFLPNLAGESFLSGLTFRTELGRKTPLPLLLFLLPGVAISVASAPSADDILKQNAERAAVDTALDANSVFAASRTSDSGTFYVAVRHGDEYRIFRGKQAYSGPGYELAYVDNPAEAMGIAIDLSKDFDRFATQTASNPNDAFSGAFGPPTALTLENMSVLHQDEEGQAMRRASRVHTAQLPGGISQEAAATSARWRAIATAIGDGGYPYVANKALPVVPTLRGAEADNASKSEVFKNIGLLLAGWMGLSLAAGATAASRRSRAGFKSRAQKPQ